MSSFPLLPGDASYEVVYPHGSIDVQLQKPRPPSAAYLVVGELSLLQTEGLAECISAINENVSPELFKSAVAQLSPGESFGDSCSVLLKLITVAALPTLASRHNSAALPHAIKAAVEKAPRATSRIIIVVCNKDGLYSSGCAVARAFPRYSQKAASRSVESVDVVFFRTDEDVPSRGLSEEDAFAFSVSGQSIRMTQSIVDRPCNLMHTDAFVDLARDVAKFTGCDIHVVRGQELDKQGFGGIYGVGKAADHPPAMVVLSHRPADAERTIAWVGKGIVYDTGGLSLKPKGFMAGMKRDCGGAAGILGAFATAVKLGFKDNLHCILCLAENAVSPIATRPDDVHVMYSGRSVEVNNPDAEGRLVLADGVHYASKDLNADVVLDMATLTGAQGIATGRYHGALLANNEDWQDATCRAGRVSGDLVFPVPFTPELHMPEFSSAVADMKNSVERRDNAQPSCAGLFIHAHLLKDYTGAWIHVDMAGPVHQGERATGYGVALLVSLFGSCTNSSLLHFIAPSLPSTGASDEPPRKRRC
eukprot:scpid60237/ scgid20034/ Probable aminopeptidase NPEPL1; Aminopeptidase-like 1